MAKKQWTKQKVNPQDINGGYEYDVGDQLSLESINAIVNNAFAESSGGSATWGGITGNIDDQEDLKTKFGGKQDTLISGINIKTINDESILGEGNIVIQGGVTQSDIQNMLVSSLTKTETWILPQNLPMKADDGLKVRTWDVNFTSNNIKFTQFRIHDYYADGRSVYYNDTRVFYINNAPTPIQYIWANDAYRTIIFDEPVTGTLRTWLINHDAVKQSDSGTPNKATGEIGTIKKHSDELEFYPKTFIECVYSEDGKTLDTLMPSANPATTTETPDLTSMTINGIAYKISGGSGGASANYNYYWGE